MGYFQEALKSLRPNKEFSTYEDDSIIVWQDETVVTPTDKEIAAKIEELKLQDAAKAIEKAEAKAALLAKLGLTAEEAELLVK